MKFDFDETISLARLGVVLVVDVVVDVIHPPFMKTLGWDSF